jgi:hypothetical protein
MTGWFRPFRAGKNFAAFGASGGDALRKCKVCSRLRVNLRAFFDERSGFFFHAFVEGFLFGDLLLGGGRWENPKDLPDALLQP